MLGTGRIRAVASASALAALAALIALAIAGCGGGSGTESDGEVAAKVEVACAKVNGYAVWLPEYVQKTDKSIDQATAVMHSADDEFRSTLESLDPPADLTATIAKLEAGNTQTGTEPAKVKAALRRSAALYEEVGATDCSKASRAGIKTLDGASVQVAYRQEGLQLPPRPHGW